MVEDIDSGSLSLYRDKGDENFPQKLAAALAITSTHIIKTTFWKMRLDANPYIMTCGTPTGIPSVDDAHATIVNFIEDDLVHMLDAADIDRDVITVYRKLR